MILLLIGPSGAGKGTQAELLSQSHGFAHVGSGNLFRDNIYRGTALGMAARRYLNAGALVPEDLPSGMVRERLERTGRDQDIILDGYPRTEYQAAVLNDVSAELDRPVVAIYLDVSDDEIVTNRTPGRLTCRECQRPYHEVANPPRRDFICDSCDGELYRRNDDTPDRTRARLKVFHRETAPLIEHYQKTGRLVIVPGEQSIAEVHERLAGVIESLRRNDAQRATAEEAASIRELEAPPRAIAEGESCYLSLDLVLLGAPGSGKGTQAAQLRSRLGLPHIATGDLFRMHLADETDLGRLAKGYMDRGDLVPDDVTQSMVRERLGQDDTREGFVLDGFPRTLPQAAALTDMMTEMNRRLGGVLYIRVSDEEILGRLTGRRICRTCQTPYHVEFQPPKQEGVCDLDGGELYQRDDDNAETVSARLETFHRQTAPLVDHYRREGVLIELEGEGNPEEITKRTLEAAEGLKRF